MILIFARSVDPHADRMAALLTRRKIDHFRLDTSGFPQSVSQSIRYANGDCLPSIAAEGRRLNFSEVRSVWNHRQFPPRASEQISPGDREFAMGESMHFVNGLWLVLKDRFWVNPLQAGQAAESKPHQLKVAKAAGFNVPRTLMTNDPDEAVAFFEECDRRVIYKAFNQYNRPSGDGGYLGIYTNIVDHDDLLARREQIRLAPCIFQEYVPKQVELRVTAIGNQIFTVAIDAQRSPRGREDWRRFDHDNTSYEGYELPEPLKALIRDLLQRLGLVFAGIDLVLTPDGRFVFLEVNKVCQWY